MENAHKWVVRIIQVILFSNWKINMQVPTAQMNHICDDVTVELWEPWFCP